MESEALPVEIVLQDDQPAEKSKQVENVDMVFSSIVAASRIKGGLTMQDCRQLTDAKDVLEEFFTVEAGEPLPEVTRIQTDALSFLTKLAEIQQLTGVFTVEGSIKLLDALEDISDEIEERKNNAQKVEARLRKIKAKNGRVNKTLKK